jgi:tetratricopeptide (TPR) repeat protein
MKEQVTMKRFLSVSLLAAMAVASAGSAAAQQPAAGGEQQLVIKDQAEYQAYTSAVGQTDANAKAQALEAFLQKYPNTVVKKEALDQLLAAYQQSANQPKMLDVAQRMLQVDPNNEQAAIVVAYVRSTQAQQAAAQAKPGDPQAQQAVVAQYQEAAQAAQKALDGIDKLQKPANVDDAAFQQQKSQIATVMNATIGLSNYLAGNYQAAIQPLFKAVQANPQDVADMEYLGISLAMPVTRAQMYKDPQSKQQLMEGVFWLAKAASMAPPQAKQQFTSVAQYYYNRYHGSTEGFEQALSQSGSLPNPSGYQIAAAPSPQDQAAQVLASTPPDQILVQDGFDTWASILTVAAPADAQRVWDGTKGKKLELAGTVVNATPEQIQLAVSDQAIAEKRADVTVQLAKPVPTPPAVGTESYPVVGIASAFNAQPTFQLTLTDGAPNVKTAAPKKSAAKKAPARRAPARRRPR